VNSAIFQCSLGICNGGAINMTIPNGNNGGSIRMACCTGANQGDMFLTGGGGVGVLIAGSGNIGIGNTDPLQALHLGQVSVISQDANSMYVGANFGKATDGCYIKSQYANQIHFDSATGYINFKVAGSGTAGNTVSYTTAVRISSTGETCFKCNAYFCASTYGIMGFGEKVMDKICYITTTSGTLCVALDGLTYSNGPTRAIYLYGTLLDNDAAHYAHMIYFYRNDYGGLQTCTISQSSLVHPSTAGQPFTFSVNDPGSIGKESCTLLLRFTSAGAGVAAGSYCTKMRIVVYNVPGL